MTAVRPNDKENNLLENLAKDYAEYFKVNTSLQKQQLDFELEAILVQLEEYKSFLNEIKNENCILFEEAQKIYTHYEALQTSFQRIDCLDNLVCTMKTDLNNLETAVSKAERDLTDGSSISAVFRPFLFVGTKEPPLVNISDYGDYTPELKFNVNDYFSSTDKNVLDKPEFNA